MKRALLAVPVGLLATGTASAQDATAPFTGPRVGASIGLNTGIDKNVLPAPETKSKKKGVVIRGTAGYDIPIGERAIVGAEVSIATGGRDITTKRNNLTYKTDPNFTLDAVGRIGFVPTEGLLLFGKAGWAMQKVTTARTTGNTTVSMKGTEHGVLWGAGAEIAMGPRTAFRVEYDRVKFNEHYSRNRVLGGISLRF